MFFYTYSLLPIDVAYGRGHTLSILNYLPIAPESFVFAEKSDFFITIAFPYLSP